MIPAAAPTTIFQSLVMQAYKTIPPYFYSNLIPKGWGGKIRLAIGGRVMGSIRSLSTKCSYKLIKDTCLVLKA